MTPRIEPTREEIIEAQNKKLFQQIGKLQQELSEAMKVQNELENTSSRLREKIEHLTQKITDLNLKNHTLNKQNFKLTQDTDKLKQEHFGKITALNDENANLQKTVANLQQQNTHLQEEIISFVKTTFNFTCLLEKNNRYILQVLTLEQEKKAHFDTVANLNKEISTLLAENKKKSDTIQSMQSFIDKNNHESMSNKIALLNQQKQEHLKKITELISQNAGLQNTVASLTQEKNTYLQTNYCLNNDISKLLTENHKKNTDVQSMQNSIENIKQENAYLHKANNMLVKTNDMFEKTTMELTRSLSEQSSSILQLPTREKEKQAYSEKISELNDIIAQLNAEISKLKIENKENSVTAEKMEKENAHLSKTIHHLENEISGSQCFQKVMDSSQATNLQLTEYIKQLTAQVQLLQSQKSEGEKKEAFDNLAKKLDTLKEELTTLISSHQQHNALLIRQALPPQQVVSVSTQEQHTQQSLKRTYGDLQSGPETNQAANQQAKSKTNYEQLAPTIFNKSINNGTSTRAPQQPSNPNIRISSVIQTNRT